MEQAGTVQIDGNAGVHEGGEVGPSGGGGEEVIGVLGDNQLDVDAAVGGHDQRHQSRLIGHEIGSGKDDALPGGADGGQQQPAVTVVR
jgi:hypothetical protein